MLGGKDHVRRVSPYKVNQHPLQVTQADSKELKAHYNISSSITLDIPFLIDIMSRPLLDQITLYIHKIRLLLHPFLCLTLLDFGVTQHQPYVIQSLIAMWILYRLQGSPNLILWESCRMFRLKNCAQKTSFGFNYT